MKRLISLCLVLCWWSTVGFALDISKLKRECNKGYGKSCAKLAEYYYYKGQGELNSKYIHKSCDVGYGEACLSIGHSFFTQKQYRSALGYYKKGCSKGHARSCASTGTCYEMLEQNSNAKKAYSKACNSGIDIACGNLGVLYLKERTQGKDHKIPEVLPLLKTGCEGSSGRACYGAGMVILEVVISMGTAMQKLDNAVQLEAIAGIMYYWDKGCKLGFKEACSQANKLRQEVILSQLR